MAGPPWIPSMVDGSGFEVGRTGAATRGAEVLRTEAFQLIQCRPQTETVREIPLLIVPPTINKYYAIDLAPAAASWNSSSSGTAGVRHVLAQSRPGVRRLRPDTYVQADLEALDVTERICRTAPDCPVRHVPAASSRALTAGYLAATGTLDRLAGLTLAVPVLDNAQAGTAGVLLDRALADAATAAARRRGNLDGRTLAEVFAWLRPGGLVWNYWVNDYLLGRRPQGSTCVVLEHRHHADA